ncbi:hypothetical protein BJ912DRAFT_1068397 [Pholiota molesta]|nr:hypothetical protein BJ912DRAFT_1068397 [Pholiota molesta]
MPTGISSLARQSTVIVMHHAHTARFRRIVQPIFIQAHDALYNSHITSTTYKPCQLSPASPHSRSCVFAEPPRLLSNTLPPGSRAFGYTSMTRLAFSFIVSPPVRSLQPDHCRPHPLKRPIGAPLCPSESRQTTHCATMQEDVHFDDHERNVLVAVRKTARNSSRPMPNLVLCRVGDEIMRRRSGELRGTSRSSHLTLLRYLIPQYSSASAPSALRTDVTVEFSSSNTTIQLPNNSSPPAEVSHCDISHSSILVFSAPFSGLISISSRINIPFRGPRIGDLNLNRSAEYLVRSPVAPSPAPLPHFLIPLPKSYPKDGTVLKIHVSGTYRSTTFLEWPILARSDPIARIPAR